MTRLFTILLFSIIAQYLSAQSFYIQPTVGPSVGLYDQTTSATVNVSVGYEATPDLSVLLLTSFQNGNIVPEQSHPTTFVTPAVKYRVVELRKLSASLLAGVGLGHSFTSVKTDHNFHNYIVSAPIEYAATPNLSFVIEPSFEARSWQGHIGFHRDYSQIGVALGFKRYLRTSRK